MLVHACVVCENAFLVTSDFTLTFDGINTEQQLRLFKSVNEQTGNTPRGNPLSCTQHDHLTNN